MMFHRSDWLEIGLDRSVQSSDAQRLMNCKVNEVCYRLYEDETGIELYLKAEHKQFESYLYNCPMWEVRLESLGPEDMENMLRLPHMHQHLTQLISTLLSDTSMVGAYIFAKVVAEEPLYSALANAEFQAVENRRIYKCNVKDLISNQQVNVVSGIQFVHLDELKPEIQFDIQKKILNICRGSFNIGHSRHFKDLILRNRLSGTDYIVAVMKQNFELLEPRNILLAMMENSDEVCGFSVVGPKHGAKTNIYTQLLSAVAPAYRGRGIYGGLTNLLIGTLPTEATLLNVTHVETESIQRAYRGSGRVYMADIILMRRFCSPPTYSK